MSTAQSSVRVPSTDQKLALIDDDLAAVAIASGYYDPDSAAYDEEVAIPVMAAGIPPDDEGLPIRELVTV